LRERAKAILAPIPGSFSALVVVDGVGRVVEIDAGVARPPASALKVLTGGAALLALGAEHRFVTSVRALGNQSPAGVLDGDLVLVGGGDPTLTTSDLATLAKQVAAAGIVSVSGRLVVDDGRFEQMTPPVGWKPSFVPGEVGRVTAFIVDRNQRLDPDPSLANLQRLRAALSAKGVTVAGVAVRSTADAAATAGRVVAVRSSAPLGDIVTHMMKRSDNTEAEVLLREIGAVLGSGSSSLGIDGVGRQLDRFGVTRPAMFDGSGLSSSNRVTTETLVGWLTAVASTKQSAAFRASLPVACVDGTLKGRMCRTSAAGNVRAKTGYINNVVTLAGYATTASGRNITFAVLGSNLRSTSAGRAAIDRLMVELTSSLV
jgi:D-alanyl-D-alanine carboxypeptidase/D-alanyl-D-alanine-endopeptidase (penicillin-binding protein 4)